MKFKQQPIHIYILFVIIFSYQFYISNDTIVFQENRIEHLEGQVSFYEKEMYFSMNQVSVLKKKYLSLKNDFDNLDKKQKVK